MVHINSVYESRQSKASASLFSDFQSLGLLVQEPSEAFDLVLSKFQARLQEWEENPVAMGYPRIYLNFDLDMILFENICKDQGFVPERV